jgi:hypothetical protein
LLACAARVCLQAFPAHNGEVLALQASASQAGSFLVSGGTDFQVQPVGWGRLLLSANNTNCRPALQQQA